MNYVVFGVILMALILLHEMGHYLVAKRCGMRVERFSIFFGRPIARFTRGETEFRVGWIPLGGYVKITGMTREELFPRPPRPDPADPAAPTWTPPEPDPEIVRRSYFAQSPGKRIATIFAGPAVNIVLAYLVFVVAFWIGPPSSTTTVEVVSPATPAQSIGLRPGDELVRVNDVTADGGFRALQDELRANPGREVTVVWRRDGRDFTREVTLAAVRDGGDTIGQLGFRPTRENVSSGFGGGFVDGADFTWTLVAENFKALGRVFTDEAARDQIGTVVGIGAVYDDVQEDGFLTVLRYIGYISLILGVFNLLPLLPLDGGHITFTVIEALRRRPITRAVYERASMVGLAVLLVVFFFGLQNDIGRLSGEGFGQ